MSTSLPELARQVALVTGAARNIGRTLCSPGGRYVTGQTMHVNGGLFLT